MKFSKELKEKLLQNQYVNRVTSEHVCYSKEFKQKAVREYNMGKSARQIFVDAGFNTDEYSTRNDYAAKIIGKWRQRENTNIHEPQKRKKAQNAYQNLIQRNEYLEAENEFLKKLHALNDAFR